MREFSGTGEGVREFSGTGEGVSEFPIELSRDITEISPLWELLPFNLS